MFKENDEARKEVSLDIWHAAGYDGEGLNILLCDLNGVILPHMKEYCILVDPENKMLKVPKHNTYTAQVLHEALPKAKIYVAPWTHSSKEISDWLDANPGLIHMANVSLSSPVSDAYDVFKRHNILVCCSSGNDSKRTKYGVSFPADLPWTIAFGAYNWKDKSLYANDVVNYSNGGEDLDAVSCTNIKVQNDKGKLFDYTGTSTASPWGCATLGAYVLWRLKNGLPLPTWEEAKEFIHKNCTDLREKGFDYDSGYGLFCLPKELPKVEKTEEVFMMDLVSSQCVDFVKSFEGFCSTPYYDLAGVKTLGYGMTGSAIEGLSSVTEQQASDMLKDLLNTNYAQPLKNSLDSKGVALTQNEFDALVSMAYNVGIGGLLGSTLYKNVCAGIRNVSTITENFCAWCHAGGVVVAGLLRRRKEEAKMFFGSENKLEEEEDVLKVAVLLFTKEDFWAGYDVAAKNGNCAIFVRPGDLSVPAEAQRAEKLIVVGGGTTGHKNEVLLSGNDKYATAAAVAKYLG